MRARLVLLVCLVSPLLASAVAEAQSCVAPTNSITRAEIITRAQTYAYHPWHCAAANLTGQSCPSGYSSVYTVGDHMGPPYDWGGYMTIDTFDRGIRDGYGAGSYSSDGILSCTVGLDCSGFVSKAWNVGHCGTSLFGPITNQTTITRQDVLPGDAFNTPGYHIILYSHTQENGLPFFFESAGYNVHATYNQGWTYVEDFTPLRRNLITGGLPGDLLGTAGNPIEITTFPYVHNGNTATSTSDMFDYCAEDWTKNETGPEVIYHLTIDRPGSLVLKITDGTGVDIDVHVYEALNELDCIGRAHEDLTQAVGCGEYWIVADTWVGADGTEYAGAYRLDVTFTPSTAACGASHAYDFLGELGNACAFEGNENLPFCNENLGTTVCLATGDAAGDVSWCSVECTGDGDCTGAMPGGCCADIGYDSNYCVIADFCDGDPDIGPEADLDSAPDMGPDVQPDLQDDPDQGPDPIDPPDSTGDPTTSPDSSTTDIHINDSVSPTPDSSSPDGHSGEMVTRNEGCACDLVLDDRQISLPGLAILLGGVLAFLYRRKR